MSNGNINKVCERCAKEFKALCNSLSGDVRYRDEEVQESKIDEETNWFLV
jgi:hypothetical protein